MVHYLLYTSPVVNMLLDLMPMTALGASLQI